MLIAYPVKGKKKSIDLCQAFIEGYKRAGGCEPGAVFFGVNESNIVDWHRVLATGSPYWYGDNAFFDATRQRQFRFAKNRLQIDAAQQTDGKRFAALGLEVKPMRRDGHHWVVCEQSPFFVEHVAPGAKRWLEDTVTALRATERPVVVRAWDRDKTAQMASLPSDLTDAWGLVTHSSAAAVTALLEGVGVVVSPNSACSSIWLPDGRENLFGVLADNQWTIEELATGKAWQWLNRTK